MSEIRYHVMSEDKSEHVALVACRASEEGAHAERDRAQAAAEREDRFLIVWVDRISADRCTCRS